MRNYTSLFLLIAVVLVGVVLYWHVDRRHQDYISSQQALAVQSTMGVASLIGLYIKEARRRVVLFTEAEVNRIGNLARDPSDERLQEEFAQSVKRHFPESFASTITDKDGEILVDDFDGKIAALCEADIHQFAEQNLQNVSIHPNPVGYHFDIMAHWQGRDGNEGIIFVSLKPTELARILANSQLHDHQLILLHRNKPGLIEVTADGSRVEMEDGPTLSAEEMARISFTADVAGSLWTLADLPAAGLFAAHKQILQREAASIFLVFLLFSGVIYLLARRAELRRASAEQAVRQSRIQLEKRVVYRTQQLSEINTQLESEIHERNRAELALKQQIEERRQTEDALRALHAITSAHDLPFQEKLMALLENGCRQFNLPIGILSHIYGDNYEVIQAISPDNSIPPGSILELGNTYCSETIKARGPIGFEHAEKSEWKTHPCYRDYKLETYFGIPVVTGTDVYGTLNFSSPTPRNISFTSTDKEVLNLMGQWVGGEIYRQQTEQALKNERNRAQRYLDVAGTIILVIGADQKVRLINKKGCQLLGKEEQDIIGRNWFDTVIPAGIREHVRGLFDKLMSQEQALIEYYHNPVLTSSGEERLIAWHNTLLYDDDGNVTASLSSGEDITVQQHAEEQLRQREEQLRLTLENAPIGILTTDLEGKLLTVNPTLCTVLGYSPDELTGMTVKDITHPDDWEETMNNFQQLIEGDIKSYEMKKRYIRRDGAVITGRARAGLVRDAHNEPLMVVGEIADITQRERAETLLGLVVESAPNGIIMVDPTGRILLVNKQTEKYFGYRREELLGEQIETLVPERMRSRHPDYRNGFIDEHRARAMGLGRNLFGLRKDGSEFPIEIGLSPVETDQELLILSAIVDISERVQVDHELQRMRTYLKNIIDSMPSVLVGVDKQGRVTEWNQSAVQTTRVPTERAIGELFGTLFPEFETQLDNIQEAIRSHSPIRTERLITEKNGETQYADVMVYPLLEDGAAGAVIRIDDITNRVRMEQMMVQTEKMMSVGGLAAGMAHEINNPLSGVLQSSQNIQRRLSADLETNRRTAEALGIELQLVNRYLEERGIPEFVESIRQTASRASRIVADMLAFSRSATAEFLPAHIHEILDTVVRLAASDYDLKKKYDFKQVEIMRDYDPELELVVCDHTEIEQVFLNLVKNAAQAMGHSNSPPPHRITLRTRKDGEYARIEVEDSGPGMDEQTRRRVFEPFFTTKAVGEGTGLGLSVSYFMVTEQHKGTVDVTSTPGEGTCFTVRLPLHHRSA
ncbi:MAG: PAS domain S-box protein [Thiogranum sp.]